MGIHGYFDTMHGTCLYGWAWDEDGPGPVSVEAVTADGQVIGSAIADVFRGDLLKAGYGDGRCSFKIDIGPRMNALVDSALAVRVGGTGSFLAGSPQVVTLNPNYRYLLSRPARVAPYLRRLRARLDKAAAGHGISIVMPVHNTPQAWLLEALESVRHQWCGAWELICVDDASTQPHVRTILQAYAEHEPRIRLIPSRKNVGIAAATNFGLRAARYDYVTFMDHDDYLEPDAVWKLIRAARTTKADLIYSDEVLTSESINHFIDLRARPAFSHDYYLSHPYFVHLICVKRDVAHAVCGWDEGMAISADVDFVLRVIERARVVAHVPSVLYRWRTYEGSTGHRKQDAVTAASVDAIQRHLDRLGTAATAAPGVSFNQYRVAWPTPDGVTLIVVPTKNGVDLLRTCVRSIEQTADSGRYRLVVIDHQSTCPRTRRFLREVRKRHVVIPYEGPFNFSRMNNTAVARHGAGCEFVLCMNNDVEAIGPGWLERLASLAARPDIGVVGPTLLFSDRRIQHAGVVIGFCDAAEHVGKFVPFEDEAGGRTLGSNSILTSVRDFSAVTAACMMMRRSVFLEVGGYREEFAVAFNDTDLCLRVREAGLRVLYDGHTVLYHHESATRAHTNDLVHPEDTALFQETWGSLMAGGDPFYSPFLSLAVQDHVLRNEVAVPRPPRIIEHARPVADVQPRMAA